MFVAPDAGRYNSVGRRAWQHWGEALMPRSSHVATARDSLGIFLAGRCAIHHVHPSLCAFKLVVLRLKLRRPAAIGALPYAQTKWRDRHPDGPRSSSLAPAPLLPKKETVVKKVQKILEFKLPVPLLLCNLQQFIHSRCVIDSSC
jgi:hypothetical protein